MELLIDFSFIYENFKSRLMPSICRCDIMFQEILLAIERVQVSLIYAFVVSNPLTNVPSNKFLV